MAVRFYDSAPWLRLRRAKLAANPLCEACQVAGIVTPAKAVDHIVPINGGGPALPPLDGLASLCIPCHNAKTASVDHGHGGRHVQGFDVDGNPLDAGDKWHGGGHAGQPHNTPDTLPLMNGGLESP